jgi:hypothetical protein
MSKFSRNFVSRKFSKVQLSDLFWSTIRMWQYFPFPASVFSYTFVFAKVFIIFVTFRKLFSRKAKINFRENTKTKIFVSTLVIFKVKKFTLEMGQELEPYSGSLKLCVGKPASKRRDFNVVLSFHITFQLCHQNHTRVPIPTVLTSLADYLNTHIDLKLSERYRISQKAILFHRYRIRIDSAYNLYRAFASSSRGQYFLYIIKCMYWDSVSTVFSLSIVNIPVEHVVCRNDLSRDVVKNKKNCQNQ